MEYYDIADYVALALFSAWPFIQNYLWWPTIKSFCNGDEVLVLRFIDPKDSSRFADMAFRSFVVWTFCYGFGSIMFAATWFISIPVLILFCLMYVIRLKNKLKIAANIGAEQ